MTLDLYVPFGGAGFRELSVNAKAPARTSKAVKAGLLAGSLVPNSPALS